MIALRFAVSRRKVLAVLVSALFLALPISGGAHAAEDEKAEETRTVSLVIDYGDGVQKHVSLPWKEGMTVLDALEAAAKHPRGIKFKSRGKGETAFVSAIDDLENEGSGRNWTYRVNDKPATKSCGVAELAAGDVALWRFRASR
jgi:hypothetical protein